MFLDWLVAETISPDVSITIGFGAAALYFALAVPFWLLPKLAGTLRFADGTVGEAAVPVTGGICE